MLKCKRSFDSIAEDNERSFFPNKKHVGEEDFEEDIHSLQFNYITPQMKPTLFVNQQLFPNYKSNQENNNNCSNNNNNNNNNNVNNIHNNNNNNSNHHNVVQRPSNLFDLSSLDNKTATSNPSIALNAAIKKDDLLGQLINSKIQVNRFKKDVDFVFSIQDIVDIVSRASKEREEQLYEEFSCTLSNKLIEQQTQFAKYHEERISKQLKNSQYNYMS